MTTFHQDLILTVNNSNQQYMDKIQELLNNKNLVENVSVENSDKLIGFIKEYKCLINSICLSIDKINNFKNYTEINNNIENELMIKMIPIMNIYRTLLMEKYSDKLDIFSTINNQD